MPREADYWILSDKYGMVHWNDLVMVLRAIFGNIFRLYCQDICIGMRSVAERSTNTLPVNATASFQKFISGFVVASSNNPFR